MDDFKSKNLGFVYHIPFWKENGDVWTTFSPIGRYVEALARDFKTVTLIAPVRKKEHQPLYRVRASNLHIISVKSLDNVQGYYFHLFHFYTKCFSAIKKVDILNIRVPTLTGFPAFLAARFYRKPTFLVVVGENFEFIKRAGYSGIKKLTAQIVSLLQDQLMKQMIKKSFTFTNGEDLFNKYHDLNKNVSLMRSSTINQGEILPTFRDTCQTATCRILTVAVVSSRKGTSLIPEIIARLRDKSIQVTWKYIGYIEGNSGQMELIKTRQLARDLDVHPYLSFEDSMGYDRLLPLYRESDIFVLPTYMEGIPRVILEAQASGLPVITTKVGGIPQAVEDGVDAILTSPGNPVELTDAILKVIQDPPFRQGLISKGLITAQKYTLESETKRMLDKVEKNIRNDAKL